MMKFCTLFGLCLLLLSSCFVLQNSAVVYRLQKAIPDTSFVYALPFASGTEVCIWQGYHSLFSHWGNYAVDFRVDPGTAVHAARAGVVAVVKEDNMLGGVGRRFVGKENSIVIKHSDSTYAHYLHLRYRGAEVSVGDTVIQGQLIGYSGSTGFSAFPHLHFEVTRGLQKATSEMPFRFRTQKGVVFLQPLQRYRSPHRHEL